MATFEVRLDAGLFSADMVTKAAHRCTDAYFVEIKSEPAEFVVQLTPRHAELDTGEVADRLRNDVLDEKLRALVRSETQDIHAVLIEAALRQASSPNSGPRQ
jgi:His-Xaa-Ser system protein HxsD